MDGSPKVEITWLFNEMVLDVALPRSSYKVMEPVQGGSVLILDLDNAPLNLSYPMQNPILGPFTIQCIGSSLGGQVEGRANLHGES